MEDDEDVEDEDDGEEEEDDAYMGVHIAPQLPQRTQLIKHAGVPAAEIKIGVAGLPACTCTWSLWDKFVGSEALLVLGGGGGIFGQTRVGLKSWCFQVQPVTCCGLLVFLK
jgi:hypothetical protein